MILLLTDTCAVIKLLAPGLDLFKPGLLSIGDLTVHPLLFSETKKWRPDKKTRLAAEIARISTLKAPPNVRISRQDFEAQSSVIRLVEDDLNMDIGNNDREYLATVLCNDDMELVTNDIRSLGTVARQFEVSLRCAEEILLVALNEKVITATIVQRVIDHWAKVGEPVSGNGRALLKKSGFRC
jgi:hypothetical protein